MTRSVFTLTRFSFLSSDDRGYGRTKGLSFEDKRARVFDPARLDKRFAAFERICLPSLAAQRPDVFGAIILASDMLPEPCRTRLSDLLKPYGNLRVAFEPPAPMPFEDLWLKHLDGFSDRGEVVLTARLDDDDALAADFAERALTYVEPHNAGHCVSFPSGLHMGRVDGQVRAWETYLPGNSAGLGYVSGPGERKTVHGCGHHLHTDRSYPTIYDARDAQYLMTLHEENDTFRVHGRAGRLQRLRSWFRPRRPSYPTDRLPRGATMSLAEARERYGHKFSFLGASDLSFV